MSWWVQLIACGIAAASFSVLLRQPRNTIPVSSLVSIVGYSVFLLLGQSTLAYFLASLLIGLSRELAARLMKRAATLFVTGAIVPLVPGVGLYRTMRFVVDGEYSLAVQTGAATLLGICGIAMAITISSVIFSSFWHPNRKKRGASC
ncbi:MAG: threonine/serine exporter family protein [Clostridia bacterium]|nr:threonine/serine exporter family protein [Clostridia bacterium]